MPAQTPPTHTTATVSAPVPVPGTLCVHCNWPVCWDGHEHWVHLEGGYPCRDYSTMRSRTYATPPPSPWPPYEGQHAAIEPKWPQP